MELTLLPNSEASRELSALARRHRASVRRERDDGLAQALDMLERVVGDGQTIYTIRRRRPRGPGCGSLQVVADACPSLLEAIGSIGPSETLEVLVTPAALFRPSVARAS